MVALGYPLPSVVPVTRRYGDTSIRSVRSVQIGAHTGIDLGARLGTPVLASAAGTVAYGGWRADGAGNTVWIDHGGGVQTRYAHLSVAMVRKGASVAAGRQIGTVGATGLAIGAHLHYEVWSGSRHVDPAPYLGGSASIVGVVGGAGGNVQPAPADQPGGFPLDPGMTCPVGYLAGTVNPRTHGWLPGSPWFNRPTNPDGTINACVREGSQEGDNLVTSDIMRIVLPFTLEATLNVAAIALAGLLVYRGTMTLLKP